MKYKVTVIRNKTLAKNLGYKPRMIQQFDSLKEARQWKEMQKRNSPIKITIKKIK